MQPSSRVTVRFAFASLCLLATAPAFSQTQLATLTGAVSDSSGAVIAGATINVANQNTGIAQQTVTNESGVYTANALIPGPYAVTVDMRGFRSQRILVTVETGQKRRLDISLELGEVAEAVEVRATPAALAQETAEIGDTVSSKEVQNIPLKGRSIYDLLALSAGVVSGGADPSNQNFSSQVSINGSRTGNNAFLIEGALAQSHVSGNADRPPSPEYVDEFKLLASTYSAQYGRTSGGTIIVHYKSGTQQYHGSLYEFYRSNVLTANSWQNNARNVKRPVFVTNHFGGTLGGPIPGLEKKMFFFFGAEQRPQTSPVTRIATIPDPALRTGDFSSSPIVINDPLTSRPFPNNTIPSSRLDPAAQKLLQLFPAPNSTGTFNPAFGIRTSNWVRSGSQRLDTADLVTRLDYKPGNKDALFVTIARIKFDRRDSVPTFDNVLNNAEGPEDSASRRYTVGYTHFFSPGWSNQFQAALLRFPLFIAPTIRDFDITRELGIQRKIGTTLPTISIAGGFGAYGNSQLFHWVHQPIHASNTMNYLKGRHSLAFGTQFYRNYFWYYGSDRPFSGNYNFNGEISGLGAAGRDNPINSLADVQLGAVKTALLHVNQIPVARVNRNFALFINDDWKATKRLTVNLGLRYEFETKPGVRNNVYSRLDLASGKLLAAGRNASDKLDLKNDYMNLAPRLGLAYSLDSKTVIRSGFGVFYSQIWGDNGNFVAYPGFTGSRVFEDQGIGRAQPFAFREGFPVEQVPSILDPLAEFAAATANRPLDHNGPTYNPTDRLSSNIQWNLGVQRSLGDRLVLDVAYVASKSTHLGRSTPINNPLLERAADVVLRGVRLQDARPFPSVAAFNAVFYDANANYHSLQIRGTRRFSSGLSVDANYTFSKNLDNATTLGDAFQIPWQYFQIERALSTLDRTHVMTAGWVYELPFAKGRRFGEQRLVRAILGGFQVNGVFSAATGLPGTITQQRRNLILQSQRPDVINPDNLGGRLESPVFEGAGARRWLIRPGDSAFPFTASSQVGFGNLGRNTSRGPGFWNMNLGVFRSVSLTERLRIQIRAEAYNAFNHVNYLNPASRDISNANYGLILSAADGRQVQLGLRLEF